MLCVELRHALGRQFRDPECDAVHRHLVRSQLARQAAAVAGERRLGSAVDRHRLVAADAVIAGAEEIDNAPPADAQVAVAGAHGIVHGQHVVIEHAAERGGVGADDGAVGGGAGGVDQDVDAALLHRDLLGEFAHRVIVQRITAVGVEPVAGGLHFIGEGVRAGAVALEHGMHTLAFHQERFAHPAADAARATDHDGSAGRAWHGELVSPRGLPAADLRLTALVAEIGDLGERADGSLRVGDLRARADDGLEAGQVVHVARVGQRGIGHQQLDEAVHVLEQGDEAAVPGDAARLELLFGDALHHAEVERMHRGEVELLSDHDG